MNHLATKLQDAHVHQTLATVTATRGGLRVVTGTAEHAAKRAVSCLVAPEVDDRVMVAVTDEGTFVLAVLEREAPGATLSTDGDLTIQPSGKLALSPRSGLELASRAVSLLAGRLELKALEGEVVVDKLGFLGRALTSEIARVKSVAATVDTTMERFSQRVARSYRTVTEMDQLRAERIDHVAEQTMNLRGKDTLMTAKRLVKVDGEQIHMG